MAQASTLMTLLIRLGFDVTGLRGGGNAAKAEMAGVGAAARETAASVGSIGTAATTAAAQATAASKVIRNAFRDPTTGRFTSPTQFANPAFAAAEAQHNAALQANVMARAGQTTATQAATAAEVENVAATEEATAATTRLNGGLMSTRLLLASFAILAFVTFMGGAAKAATEFQQSMLLLQTQAHASAAQVNLMTEAVLEIAPSVRQGPDQLAAGLYHIESVGKRSAEALDILKVAAEGARVGNANLEDVTNALVASVMSGIKGVDSMSEAMGTLNGIVGSGNMRMEQLSKSFSSGVLATAKAFGLSIQDVGAALATMTDQGIPAEEASTRLRISITQLGAPTNAAAAQLARIGLTQRRLADEMRGPEGLGGALKTLSDHLNRAGLDATEQAELIKAAFGGSRSSAGLITLIGSVGLLDQKYKIIGESSKDFADQAKAQAESAAGKFQTFSATVDVLSVRLGNNLLPILTAVAAVLGFVADKTTIVVPALMALTAIMSLLALNVARKFIVAMVQATIELVGQTAATFGLTSANIALAASEVSVAAATEGVSTAAKGMAVALAIAAAPATIAVAAIAAIGGAIALLLLKFDEVAQGWRALWYLIAQGLGNLMDLASKLPGGLGDQFKGLAANFHAAAESLKHDIDQTAQDMQDKTRSALDKALAAGDPSLAFKNAIQAGTDDVTMGGAEAKLVELFGTSLKGVVKAAGAAGADAMAEMSKEILKHQNDPLDALQTLHDLIRKALDPSVEMARLYGELYSATLAEGMASSNPAVRAQAEATTKMITDRLDELTNGLYSAGKLAGNQLAQGFIDGSRDIESMRAGGGPLVSAQVASDAAALVPTMNQISSAAADMNKQLSSAEYQKGLSDLNSAFSDIKTSAHKFFDQVHQDTLRAIDDARDHKNAILDAKEALNQAPVTAAQKALDFQRKAIQEWRLRQAVATAKDPAAYRDAVLSLRDFLAQQHIDEMQAQANTAKDVIEAKKKANIAKAESDKAAENKRYQTQQADFDSQLELLRKYLAKHPAMWASTNEKVLALLKSYGIDYHNAGSLLGGAFASGLREQVAAAQAAARAMADISPSGFGTPHYTLPSGTWATPGASVTSPTSVGRSAGGSWATPYSNPPLPLSTGGQWSIPKTVTPYSNPVIPSYSLPSGQWTIPKKAAGDWQILKDNMLAYLHQDELVAPADAAGIIRQFGSKKLNTAAAQMPSSTSGTSGGRLVVQIGDETFADIVDHRLAVHQDIYTKGSRVSTGSMR